MKGMKFVLVIMVMFLFIISIPQTSLSSSTSSIKTMELRYTYFEPPPPPAPAKPSAVVGMHYWFGEQIEKRTEGRIKFKYFPGAVLGKPFDFAAMIGGKGVADIGHIAAGYYVSGIPLFGGGSMLFLMDDPDVGPLAIWEMYNEWTPMQKEWEKVNIKPLLFFTTNPDALIIKKPIESFDDLKGKKIAGGGRIAFLAKFTEMVHASLPIGENYDALNKGVIAGAIGPYHVIKAFKWYEPAKYLVPLDVLGRGGMSSIAINSDIWNEISSADQKTIQEVSAQRHSIFIQKLEEERASLNGFYEKQGVKIIPFSAEENANIKKQYAEKILGQWSTQLKAKGVPADEFLKRYESKVKDIK